MLCTIPAGDTQVRIELPDQRFGLAVAARRQISRLLQAGTTPVNRVLSNRKSRLRLPEGVARGDAMPLSCGKVALALSWQFQTEKTGN